MKASMLLRPRSQGVCVVSEVCVCVSLMVAGGLRYNPTNSRGGTNS